MTSDDGAPDYWMEDTSGVLRPAVVAYLAHQPLTSPQIAVLRDYLRRWIEARARDGPEIDVLRVSVNTLRTGADIDHWLDRAMDAGIDPL